MPWIIKCWIPVEPDDLQTYLTKELAQKDVESLELMQPENIYEVVEIDGADAYPEPGAGEFARKERRSMGLSGCQ